MKMHLSQVLSVGLVLSASVEMCAGVRVFDNSGSSSAPSSSSNNLLSAQNNQRLNINRPTVLQITHLNDNTAVDETSPVANRGGFQSPPPIRRGGYHENLPWHDNRHNRHNNQLGQSLNYGQHLTDGPVTEKHPFIPDSLKRQLKLHFGATEEEIRNSEQKSDTRSSPPSILRHNDIEQFRFVDSPHEILTHYDSPFAEQHRTGEFNNRPSSPSPVRGRVDRRPSNRYVVYNPMNQIENIEHHTPIHSAIETHNLNNNINNRNRVNTAAAGRFHIVSVGSFPISILLPGNNHSGETLRVLRVHSFEQFESYFNGIRLRLNRSLIDGYSSCRLKFDNEVVGMVACLHQNANAIVNLHWHYIHLDAFSDIFNRLTNESQHVNVEIVCRQSSPGHEETDQIKFVMVLG